MNKKWIAGVAAILAIGGLLLAQDDADIPVLKGGTTLVQIPVSVRDADGNYINGLTQVDFQLLDEGIPQTNVKLDVESHPISLVVIVQANSRAEQLLPSVKKSASLFGPIVAGETGEIALIAFDHRVQVLTPFTSNPDQVKNAFNQLKAGSSVHHLDDAAMEAINMLRLRAGSRSRKKVLVIISETRDQGSAFTPRDVLTNAEQSDVQIYTVSMNRAFNALTSKTEPNRPNATPPEQRNPLPMGVLQTSTTDAQVNVGNMAPAFKEIFEQIKGIFVQNSHEVYTKFTGGREQNFASLSGLEEAVSRIGEEIHSQYLLTYSPSDSNKAGYHNVEVRVLTNPNYKISTRSGYWAAPKVPDPPAVKGSGSAK